MVKVTANVDLSIGITKQVGFYKKMGQFNPFAYQPFWLGARKGGTAKLEQKAKLNIKIKYVDAF